MKKIRVLVMVIFAGLCFLLLDCFNDRRVVMNSDIEKYRIYDYSALYLLPDHDSHLEAFPEKIDVKMTVNKYWYAKIRQAFSEVGISIFLDVTYTEDMYNDEIKRLKDFTREYEYEECVGSVGLLYDETLDRFDYPVYVAAYNAMMSFEYALLVGENRVVYVYLSRIREGDGLQLENFIPKGYFEFDSKELVCKQDEGFSVYYDKQMWQYDNKVKSGNG